ncbi:Zn(2)-C6 fungal-type domain-containing protein [Mycena sanguinolenta]|uniref:Zn(2)-C6 fungal-type domain-containing protein n=1 Tax=Mycena sanguinolenta TaxID=230812 RepID=A0A8H7CKE3_9AGAR|nr:Zn(2)-C6 fungal-type domain-containing protein [Mycena sanguinolenta]
MPKGLANPRGRGPYSTQACSICRSKKKKCDGVKPVCGSCSASGRSDECSWGRETVPKLPKKAHFEALQKRVESLQVYVELLEARLAKCICQDVSSHLQFRPHSPEEPSTEEDLDSDDEIIGELTVPTQRLQLNDSSNGPLLHGAFFRVENSFQPQLPTQRIPEVTDNAATYVLQVEGVDISQSHPDIEWSRHLPPEVPITRREHDRILELSFKFQTMFPIVPSLFLRDMYRALSVPRSEEPPTTLHYSSMLHNAILSVCAVYSDNEYLRDPKTRLYFLQAAHSCFDSRKPDSSMVHALSLIAAFYTDRGDRIPAELYFGMSTRICTTLGLGDDAKQWVKDGVLTHDEMTGRNWTYWAVFNRDVTWALYWGVGGPPRRNTPLPYVDSDMDRILWDYAPTKIPPQMNLLTLIFHETSTLSMIACQIADVVNNLRLSSRPHVVQVAEHVTKIDLELNNWKSRLLPQLDITLMNRASSSPQRLMLHLAYWFCFITLHRPFFNRRTQSIQTSDPEVDHVKLCTRAAENVMELLDTWSSLYTMRLASLKMSGVIFSAGTVFFLRALQATGSSRVAHGVLNTMLAQVETCIKYLHEMGRTWASAKRTGDMLQAMLNDRLKPTIMRRLARRSYQSHAVAEMQDASGAVASPAANSLSTGPTASHAHEWESQDFQLDPATAWSELLLDLNFFAQLQHTSDVGFSGATASSESDTNTVFLPILDSFHAPENVLAGSQKNPFT